MRLFIIACFLSFTGYSQSSIEIVQYSATFVKGSEISLNSFKKIQTKTLYISKAKKQFDKNKITYLPTIVVYDNGNEVKRIESGISLKLPEDTIEQIEKQVEEIIESKF